MNWWTELLFDQSVTPKIRVHSVNNLICSTRAFRGIETDSSREILNAGIWEKFHRAIPFNHVNKCTKVCVNVLCGVRRVMESFVTALTLIEFETSIFAFYFVFFDYVRYVCNIYFYFLFFQFFFFLFLIKEYIMIWFSKNSQYNYGFYFYFFTGYSLFCLFVELVDRRLLA